MKKNKLYAMLSSLLILSSFSLVSCGNKDSYSSDKSNVTAEAEDSLKNNSTNDNKIEPTSDGKVESTNDSKVEAPKDNKTEGINNENNNKLKYPVFNNISNTKNVNSLVEQFVKKISNSYNYLDMDYKIMYQDKTVISIYFNGNINSPSLAYPSKFKATLNISIDAGSQLQLNNLVNFDSKFIEKFKAALISTCNSNGFEASTVFDLENLNDLLNRADNNGAHLSDVQSYYTANQVTIILSVPHALGDYIEITLK